MTEIEASAQHTENIQHTEHTEAEEEAEERRDAFQESWRYWKNRQGSAEHHSRKMSSIDPLQCTQAQAAQVTAKGPVVSSMPEQLPNGEVSGGVSAVAAAQQVPWTQYLNVLQYIPPQPFNFGTTKPLDEQRPRSQSEASSQGHLQGWFGWMNWGAHRDDELVHDLQSTAEIRRNIKEAKKAVQSQDAVWAWYHHSGVVETQGEVSVLGTKTETAPVEMKKYPTNSIPTAVNNNAAKVVPDLVECFREITLKTKLRTSVQLYYNYPTERHLYLKRHIESPVIQKCVVISLVGQCKVKHNCYAKQLSHSMSACLEQWIKDNAPTYDHSIETISLEASKITTQSLENMVKLLINWRDNLKNADCIIVTGFKNSFPLATQLLYTLITRGLVNDTQKFGLVSIDGTIPGAYLEEPEVSTISYAAKEFDTAFVNLVYSHNVKVTIIGTAMNNVAASLALHLEHPNIFRTIHFPSTSYNNEFEVKLFQLLLIAHNLGQTSCRLLLQLSKYFSAQQHAFSAEDLHPQMFKTAVYNTLNTTRLMKQRPPRLNIIEDPILSNNYNLVWTLHAFMDNFKTLRHVESTERIRQLVLAYRDWDPQTKQLKDLKYMFEVLQIDEYSQTMLR